MDARAKQGLCDLFYYMVDANEGLKKGIREKECELIRRIKKEGDAKQDFITFHDVFLCSN